MILIKKDKSFKLQSSPYLVLVLVTCAVWSFLLSSCSSPSSAKYTIQLAQGNPDKFKEMETLSFRYLFNQYDDRYKLVNQDSAFIRLDSFSDLYPPPCSLQQYLTNPFYFLFPFSLAPDIDASFIKRDTVGNKVFHLYHLEYPCSSLQFIDHILYTNYLNDQIQAHHIKIEDQWFYIDVITKDKINGVLIPLRNKIYISDSTAVKNYLWADLIFSEITSGPG